MDPETKKVLDETLKTAKENNKMLHKMRNMMRVSRAFKTVYWMVIIGSMFGAYYYFQPFIDNIQGGFENFISIFEKSKSTESLNTGISSFLSM